MRASTKETGIQEKASYSKGALEPCLLKGGLQISSISITGLIIINTNPKSEALGVEPAMCDARRSPGDSDMC